MKQKGMKSNIVKDLHVLTSACMAEVSLIVTSNLKDFPMSVLAPWNIRAVHPDEFLRMLCDEHGDRILYNLIAEQASSYKKPIDPNQINKKPPVSDLELIAGLEKEQPYFSSRILSHAYGKEIMKTCRNILKTVEVKTGEQFFNGDNYTIYQNEKIFLITEKITERRVLQIFSDSVLRGLKEESDYIAWNLRVEDVMKFQKAAQLAKKKGLSSLKTKR
jgi:hypothetical protein